MLKNNNNISYENEIKVNQQLIAAVFTWIEMKFKLEFFW